MPGKHYTRLGKTKLVRLPEGIATWAKEIARELDTKDNPEELMELLIAIAQKSR